MSSIQFQGSIETTPGFWGREIKETQGTKDDSEPGPNDDGPRDRHPAASRIGCTIDPISG